MNQSPFNIEQHWLCPATHLPSPNFNARPDEQDISLLVIHNISLPPFPQISQEQLEYDYVSDFFLNKLEVGAHPYFAEIAEMKVSSHLFIRRSGEIIQYVPFNQRAWHAGTSHYQGRDNCNDFSIGIELEGCDDIAYEPIQYQKLNSVTKCLFEYYTKLNAHKTTGHEYIASGRKTDPGRAFNWQKYFQALAENK